MIENLEKTQSPEKKPILKDALNKAVSGIQNKIEKVDKIPPKTTKEFIKRLDGLNNKVNTSRDENGSGEYLVFGVEEKDWNNFKNKFEKKLKKLESNSDFEKILEALYTKINEEITKFINDKNNNSDCICTLFTQLVGGVDGSGNTTIGLLDKLGDDGDVEGFYIELGISSNLEDITDIDKVISYLDGKDIKNMESLINELLNIEEIKKGVEKLKTEWITNPPLLYTKKNEFEKNLRAIIEFCGANYDYIPNTSYIFKNENTLGVGKNNMLLKFDKIEEIELIDYSELFSEIELKSKDDIDKLLKGKKAKIFYINENYSGGFIGNCFGSLILINNGDSKKEFLNFNFNNNGDFGDLETYKEAIIINELSGVIFYTLYDIDYKKIYFNDTDGQYTSLHISELESDILSIEKSDLFYEKLIGLGLTTYINNQLGGQLKLHENYNICSRVGLKFFNEFDIKYNQGKLSNLVIEYVQNANALNGYSPDEMNSLIKEIINDFYNNILSDSEKKEEAKNYLIECYQGYLKEMGLN